MQLFKENWSIPIELRHILLFKSFNISLRHKIESFNVFKRIKSSFNFHSISIKLMDIEKTVLTTSEELSFIRVESHFRDFAEVGIVAVEG